MMKTSSKSVIDYYKLQLNNFQMKLALAEHEYIESCETLFKFVFDHKEKSEILTKRCAELYRKMAKAYIEMKKVENVLRIVRLNEVKATDE